MLRGIGAVVAGYIVMAVLIFLTFSGVYILMGADGAFKPESFEPSTMWLGISLVLGLAAAVAGGLVASKIARSGAAPTVLAGVVLVVGLGLGVMTIMAPPPANAPPARTAQTTTIEAMTHARQPDWITIANPIVGAAGVLVGARVGRKRVKNTAGASTVSPAGTKPQP
jgi:ABC-type transport system involved in multi-copper enzyme maturation permease subunit